MLIQSPSRRQACAVIREGFDKGYGKSQLRIDPSFYPNTFDRKIFMSCSAFFFKPSVYFLNSQTERNIRFNGQKLHIMHILTRSEHQNFSKWFRWREHAGRLCSAKNVCKYHASVLFVYEVICTRKSCLINLSMQLNSANVVCISLYITVISAGPIQHLMWALSTRHTGTIRITCR